MKVTVHYFAQLRRAIGCSRETVVIDEGATLAHLLRLLASRHATSAGAMLVDDTGRPQPSLFLAIGDEQADINTAVRDGDEITILTPMAGG
ncbi:MAG: MoaD/ThiS family protein [Gemmataceae bacterium]|nr:MoaD/ThiS family protein [Gemmataceae bacterium]